MPREFLCAAGNCPVEMPAHRMVLIREPDGGQQRFCSYRHAAEWTMRRSHMKRETVGSSEIAEMPTNLRRSAI